MKTITLLDRLHSIAPSGLNHGELLDPESAHQNCGCEKSEPIVDEPPKFCNFCERERQLSEDLENRKSKITELLHKILETYHPK